MYTIQLNESGSRTLNITENMLIVIEKYSLFKDLVDSNGYVTEEVLDKLKYTLRSLIASETEDVKDLLDLCLNVIYHDKMKAFGLKKLIEIYATWLENKNI